MDLAQLSGQMQLEEFCPKITSILMDQTVDESSLYIETSREVS